MSGYTSSASVADQITLDNGLHVVCQPDGRIPFVAFRLGVRAGARYDASLPGLAHLCEHIACEGARRGELSCAEGLYRAGGSTNGWTSHDYATFADFLPAAQALLGVAVAAERLQDQGASTTDDSTRREVQAITREHQERSTTLPYNTEIECLRRHLYPPGDPYHWPAGGTPDTVREVTRRDAVAFFNERYTPDRAVLAVVGDVGADRVFREAEVRLGRASPHTDVREPPGRLLPPLGDVHHVVTDAPYLRAYVAYRLPGWTHNGWMSGTLFAKAVALGRSSPLRRELARQRIAHDVRVYIEPQHEATTVAFVAAALPGVSGAQLETALVDTLDRVIAGGVRPDDMERMRTSDLIARHLQSDKLAVRAERLATAAMLSRWYGAVDTLDALERKSGPALLAEASALFTATQRIRFRVSPRAVDS